MRQLLGGFGAAALIAGCITVNIYFPAPEVRMAAEAIVEETWGEGNVAPPTAEPQSSWFDFLAPAPAYAQAAADINVSTAAIRALKESIRVRAAQLKPWLGAGNVGIGGDGYLLLRDMEGVALRDQATIRRLVEAENRDRRSLYAEIAKANDFGTDRIPEIEKIFAETWIDKAETGWWVQGAGSTWKQK
jgi:uncharacterized protein YdbL (DUF1318 family)